MITGERCEPVGFHTTLEVKQALRKQADKEKVSMSAFIYAALVEKLRACGYKLDL